MPFAYQCRRCKGPPLPGSEEGKPWSGPCPNCGGIYRAVRISVSSDDVPGAERQLIKDGEAISLIDAIDQVREDRQSDPLPTGLRGLDWVLNGGVWPGGTLLVCSRQGCGKTTLLLRALIALASKKVPCLYCSSEESTRQLAVRFKRVRDIIPKTHLRVVHETDIEDIVGLIEEDSPRVVVVDSLHDVSGVSDSNGFDYSTGSSQSVVLAAKRIKKHCADENISAFMVGHVTKSGEIAGTNTLQHTLDGNLYLDRVDGRPSERVLTCRNGKYRFGPDGRSAVYEMDEGGIHDRGPVTAKEGEVGGD